MSIATSPIDEATVADRYIGIKECVRIANCAASRIYRLALIGQIDVRIVRGETPTYRLADVLRAKI